MIEKPLGSMVWLVLKRRVAEDAVLRNWSREWGVPVEAIKVSTVVVAVEVETFTNSYASWVVRDGRSICTVYSADEPLGVYDTQEELFMDYPEAKYDGE